MDTRSEMPNIIFILCDDLGYGDLGCYGSQIHSTPHIDQLASEGITFTDFYMAASVCSPSRAAIMTGCYSQCVGLATGDGFPVLMPGVRYGISDRETTMPEILRNGGYRTGLVGKWHLGDQPPFFPTRHGFDMFFGFPYSNDMHPTHPKDKIYDFPLLPLMYGEQVVEVDPNQDDLTERYAREAVRFIIDNKDRPFFLMLSHKDVHVPWHAPDEAVAKSKDGYYGATVETIDRSTGLLMEVLKKLNLDDRTLVVFTSDNGGTQRASNGPLKGWKNTTWEGGLRVPCIMRWPAVIPEGRVCRQLATAMDLLPTFAALSNNEAEVPEIIDGHNIWALIADEPGAVTPYKFFLYYYGYDLKAIRMDGWKYHLDGGTLYNLDDDVGEQRDVADRYPEIVNRLSQQAARCTEDYGNGDLKGRKQRAAGEVENPETILNEEHELLMRSLNFDRQ